MDPQRNQLHVVLFPFFAFGHMSPFIQLSNKLSSHGVRTTFFSAAASVPRIKSALRNSHIVSLTLPLVDGLPPGAESTFDLTPLQSELLKVALDQMQPQIKTLLAQLKPHLVLFDFAMEWLPEMASELGIKTCIFYVFTTLAVAFLTLPARLPDSSMCPSLEQLKLPPPEFPETSITCVETFQARTFTYLFQSFNGMPSAFDRINSATAGCSAVIAKTCYEMEAPYIDYLKSQYKKPVLLAGPVVPSDQFSDDPLDKKWTEWLSRFEGKSVIFCSFGSETFLKDEDIRELALGLELTGLPFLLILNFPSNADPTAELRRALPEGFLERTKEEGRGVISTGWVQQQQILAHPSVGCYVNHAGFSSLIEGIVGDCQLVMLPQKIDQFFNSKLVGSDWGAGVEVKRREEDGHFGKEDVRRAVEDVMVRVGEEPGKSVRENHGKWRDFFLDKGLQERFVRDLVKELRGIAAGI